MSRSTVVVGINQTIMAALSMVTVAALIDAPGLGQTVLKALQTLDVGVAFNAGLAIVVIAIVLDRVTTAAGDRPWRTASIRRKVLLGAGAAGVLIAVWFSRTYVWAAEFPSSVNIGSRIAVIASDATAWVQDVFGGFTYGVRDAVTNGLFEPARGAAHRLTLVARRRGRRGAGRRTRELAWSRARRGVLAVAGRDRGLARQHGHAGLDSARDRRRGRGSVSR